MSTAGRTPQAPAVGAATMRPMQALCSPSLRAVEMTSWIKGPQMEWSRAAIWAPWPPDRPQGERRVGS